MGLGVPKLAISQVSSYMLIMVLHLPQTASGPAWKMVDVEAADAVASGSLRIGTASSYSELENGRADALDGGLRAHVHNLTVTGSDGPLALGRFGEHFKMGPSATATFVGCDFEERFPPCWLFCMTRLRTH
jgi:hypothetical protein